MIQKLDGFKIKKKLTHDLAEDEMLVKFKTELECQLFEEWLEDRGMKSFTDYVDEVYGLEEKMKKQKHKQKQTIGS